jgi:predicted tellurium resistance membrane protein TerC
VSELFELQALICLATLTGLEIVLGVDNVVFISILVGKLPPFQRPRGRRVALTIAMVTRFLLLIPLWWVMKWEKEKLFAVMGHDVTVRGVVLLLGGLFLIAKATYEIHDKLEGATQHGDFGAPAASFMSVMLNVLPLNMVFSIDSVITAIGMTQEVQEKSFTAAMIIMVVSIAVSTGVMMLFAGAIGGFIERHPTMKMLALSFLVLIGVVLVAEGMGQHISNGYIYFAMAFSIGVEMLNINVRKRAEPVHLHQTYVDEPAVEV